MLVLVAALLPAGTASGASGGFERAFGKDVVAGGPTGFEICTASATCQSGGFGGLGGEMNHPFGIATDPSGNLYVADTDNNRIQKFNSAGTWDRAWGKNVKRRRGLWSLHCGFELSGRAPPAAWAGEIERAPPVSPSPGATSTSPTGSTTGSRSSTPRGTSC